MPPVCWPPIFRERVQATAASERRRNPRRPVLIAYSSLIQMIFVNTRRDRSLKPAPGGMLREKTARPKQGPVSPYVDCNNLGRTGDAIGHSRMYENLQVPLAPVWRG